jgi:hypothetical protein
MIEVPTLDELRETRRRLAEQQGGDPQRYAAMLAQVSDAVPGTYVSRPLLPQGSPPRSKAKAS